MPPILAAFWIFLGLAGARALTDPTAPIYAGVDPKTHTGGDYKIVRDYYIQTSKPWVAVTRDKTCDVTVVVWTVGGPLRMRFNGVEQNVDWSWSFDMQLNRDMKYTYVAKFLDPIGGKELATRTTAVACVGEGKTEEER